MAPAPDHWTLTGAQGETILGETDHPDGPPRGVVIICHGFKGYKDYGMFPWLGHAFARAGWIAHRFNFSHSGMTNDIQTFARPDLFAEDGWDHQVEDLGAVLDAVRAGTIAGQGLPIVLFGHSRGGATVLLTLGRDQGEHTAEVVGAITAAAPSSCDRLPADQREQLLRDGFIESPSSRTGQVLRVNRGWLERQISDPAGHDLLTLIGSISTPLCVIHGGDDPTVPAADADEIANAAPNAERHIIPGANHVFDTPNPFPVGAEPSDALRAMFEHASTFAAERAAPDV